MLSRGQSTKIPDCSVVITEENDTLAVMNDTVSDHINGVMYFGPDANGNSSIELMYNNKIYLEGSRPVDIENSKSDFYSARVEKYDRQKHGDVLWQGPKKNLRPQIL